MTARFGPKPPYSAMNRKYSATKSIHSAMNRWILDKPRLRCRGACKSFSRNFFSKIITENIAELAELAE
jgi:hypothetical protein